MDYNCFDKLCSYDVIFYMKLGQMLKQILILMVTNVTSFIANFKTDALCAVVAESQFLLRKHFVEASLLL